MRKVSARQRRNQRKEQRRRARGMEFFESLVVAEAAKRGMYARAAVRDYGWTLAVAVSQCPGETPTRGFCTRAPRGWKHFEESITTFVDVVMSTVVNDQKSTT